MGKSLAGRIAERMAVDLAVWHDPFLPPIRELCLRYGASRQTVARAAALLQKRGLVETGRGRRIAVCRLQASPPESRPDSVTRVYGAIKEEIERGALRVGEQIPKVAYFVASYRASSHTVGQALRRLAAEKLIHKDGKVWMCGPGKDRQSAHRDRRWPGVIVVLHSSPDKWPRLFDDRTGDFCRTFSSEVQRRGMHLLTFTAYKERDYGGLMPAGEEMLREQIRSLGGRYLGTLIAGSTSELPDMREWVRLLTQYRRPVVWFDRYDEGPASMQHLTRCHFAERLAVDCAADYLLERGHRRIGYVPVGPEAWVSERGHALEKAVRERDGGAVVFSPGPTTNAQLDDASVLVTCMDAGVTAIVAPNVALGVRLYAKLLMLDKRIPQDISVLTFDSYEVRFPMTSVDFGFGSLGYAAFHTILGDIPVRRDHHGNVPPRPFVIERGSVAVEGTPGAPRV